MHISRYIAIGILVYTAHSRFMCVCLCETGRERERGWGKEREKSVEEIGGGGRSSET